MSAALRLCGVDVIYRDRQGSSTETVALRDADLLVERGERVALVGRSGAGKSTVARLAVGLVQPTAGSVSVLGEELSGVSTRRLRALRRRMQMVFQDPYQSLHPGFTVAQLVSEPLAIAGVRRSEWNDRVIAALEELGMRPAGQFLDRFPGSLSGGQRQRVAIARTLVARPELILADEPASMLDASLRASVAEHLLAVRRNLDATLLFVTHDLALARHVADRVVVLADGRIVEDGPTEEIIASPAHAETRLLLESARHFGNYIQSTATQPDKNR
jgi:peptide/nickel transport system ATP-binding protein